MSDRRITPLGGDTYRSSNGSGDTPLSDTNSFRAPGRRGGGGCRAVKGCPKWASPEHEPAPPPPATSRTEHRDEDDLARSAPLGRGVGGRPPDRRGDGTVWIDVRHRRRRRRPGDAVALRASLPNPLGHAGRLHLVGCDPRPDREWYLGHGRLEIAPRVPVRPYDALLRGRLHASSSSRLLRAQRRELLGCPRCLEIESGEPGGTCGPRLPCEPAGWSAEESDGRPQGGTPGVRAPVDGSGRRLGGRTRHERRRTTGGPPGRRGFGRCPGLYDDPDLRAGGSGLSSDPSFGRPRGPPGGDRLASLRGHRARA